MCVVKGVEAMGGGDGWMVRGGCISCPCVSACESESCGQCLLLAVFGAGDCDGRLPSSGDSGITETGLSKESGANRAGARGGSCGRLFSSWTFSFLSW